MRISFDLDGVIAEGHHWFFRIVDGIKVVDPEGAHLAELEYYSSRPLKNHPNLFLAQDDEGFIITARKSHAREITLKWLRRYGIELPIYFLDGADKLDWRLYAATARKAAQLKAEVIRKLKVDVHFDNNPILVERLREILPGVRIILIGGETAV